MPGDFVPPMLAATAEEPFSDAAWWFEVKWDGYRVCISKSDALRLYSRTGTNLLTAYPELQAVQRWIPPQSIFDGELVAWRDGMPCFDALRQPGAKNLTLLVFDCLCLRNQWCLHEPFSTRLQMLQEALPSTGPIAVSQGIRGVGIEYFRAARDAQMEGVMAKHLGSLYYPGRRTKLWRKCLVEQKEWFWVIDTHQTASGEWYWSIGQPDTNGAASSMAVATVKAPRGWTPRKTPNLPFPAEMSYRSRTRTNRLRHPKVREWRD